MGETPAIRVTDTEQHGPVSKVGIHIHMYRGFYSLPSVLTGSVVIMNTGLNSTAWIVTY